MSRHLQVWQFRLEVEVQILSLKDPRREGKDAIHTMVLVPGSASNFSGTSYGSTEVCVANDRQACLLRHLA